MIIFWKMSNRQNSHTLIREISFTLLAEGKSIKIRADGYSMFPTIKPGSLISIEPMGNVLHPLPGEIVAWKRESGFVVHRLIRIIKKGHEIFFITRGDSCTKEDQQVNLENIAGRVVKVEDQNGTIVNEKKIFNYKPNYCFNRLRVFGIHILKKIYNCRTCKGPI